MMAHGLRGSVIKGNVILALGTGPITLEPCLARKAAACLKSSLVEEVTLVQLGWPHGGALHQLEEGEKPGQLLAPPGPAAIRLQSPRASKPEPPYSPCKFLAPRNHLRPWSVC